MKLSVLPTEHFACHSCGNCCRDWHVELLAGESERIQRLDWGPDEAISQIDLFYRHGGKTFLAHRADGACVFLDEPTNRCLIHQRFGAEVKPLGCRLYPFQISPTFTGQASVIARFDCPRVRMNLGPRHDQELPGISRLVRQMKLPDGFDEFTCCFLEEDQIRAVCEFAGTMLVGFEQDEQKALFLHFLCDWLAIMPADKLDRMALGQSYTTLKQQIDSVISQSIARPNWLQRMAFRTVLSLYLRRDEDVLNHRASRIGRLLAMASLLLGFGGFRALGLSHQPGKLRRAGLFQPNILPHDPGVFALHWRMIRTRLDSLQFMGSANHGRDFLGGLRSLALLYPLVKAVAKYNAGNRGVKQIDAQDVDQAVAAIEHSYGRLAILNQSLTHSLEKLLLDRLSFIRLLRGI